MGNSGSKGPFDVSKPTVALHAAIQAWDVDEIRRLLPPAGGADAWAFRVLTKEEKVAIWRPSGHSVSTRYAVNGMGKFMCELYLCLDAASGPPPFTPAVLQQILTLLLACRGVDVNSVIQRYGVDEEMKGGDTTACDALSIMIAAAKDTALAAKRARLLMPLFKSLLEAGPVRITSRDYGVWASAGGEAAIALLVASRASVTMCDADGVRTDVRLHPLLAAVDLNLLSVVRVLCAAQDVASFINTADDKGVTALMRCTGECAAPASSRDGEERRRTVALVETLLTAGADVHAVDSMHRTALHHFAGVHAAGLESSARRFACLRLLRAGAVATVKAHDGSTAITAAKQRGDAALADTLVRETAWMRRAMLVAYHMRTAAAASTA